MGWKKYIPEDLSDLYEIHDFKHAAAILANEFPDQFNEICNVLQKFRFGIEDILAAGGNESNIPKIFSDILRPIGWSEENLMAELVIYEIEKKNEPIFRSSFQHDSHKVDYVKGRVAFDLEWNSKDQTFDRDLYAFRAFFDYNAISLGILVTRSLELNTVFRELNIVKKYGASTTHMGKLLPRLEAGRNGGCPVLVFGITPRLLIRN